MSDGKVIISTALDNSGFKKGASGLKSTLKGLAASIGIAFSVAAAVAFGKASVKAATELSSAMTGLKSIMDGQGRSFKDAQGFINEYISDGLVPATQAITAYKSLAMRGYNDEQIKATMTALKDSAAFGRQASLTMGEAVASATEGLKNENSILVDNAGVTKNVSMMWKDYAKSIGVSVESLTKQQKIQAEVTGILEETRFQTGDAAKITQTYAGQVQMLSFGFNNLKIAFGNALIPILQAVLPYINALITGLTKVFNLFAQLTTALFGKQAQQQEKAAKTAGSAAGAEDKLKKSTEAAGKAADKSQASFDELNNLQMETGKAGAGEVESPEIGSGAGIVAGGEIGTGVTVSADMQAAADKIKTMLAPLANIDLSNLKTAFGEVKTALEPITSALFEGLKWGYDNILVPLTTWVIEDALPAFLDVLAEALDFVRATIDTLKPLGIWLWDNFLTPIAIWTGGLIVSILSDIENVLWGIGKWISDNKDNIEVTAGIVATFFAAWNITKLGEFIVNGGGVVEVLETLSTKLYGGAAAFGALTIAKLKDKLETAYLVALYAKDFVVSLVKNIANLAKETAAWISSTAAKAANAVAQGVMTAVTVVWNATCAIATVVTSAFGAAVAFLTSPIGIAAVAIAALIAAVVLLTKNWDTVKEVAIKVWDKIKAVWNGVAKWFIDVVLTPLEKAFKGSINFLIGLAEGFVNFFIKGINAIINALNKISFDIPDWVPLLGGNKFGINIPNVPQIKIPALAQGAVIPPNREFMAVLGDQKHGTNIETPEGLLRQIVAEEIAKNGGGAQDINIHFTGTLAQAVRLLGPEIARETRRKGVCLVTGGV